MPLLHLLRILLTFVNTISGYALWGLRALTACVHGVMTSTSSHSSHCIRAIALRALPDLTEDV